MAAGAPVGSGVAVSAAVDVEMVPSPGATGIVACTVDPLGAVAVVEVSVVAAGGVDALVVELPSDAVDVLVVDVDEGSGSVVCGLLVVPAGAVDVSVLDVFVEPVGAGSDGGDVGSMGAPPSSAVCVPLPLPGLASAAVRHSSRTTSRTLHFNRSSLSPQGH